MERKLIKVLQDLQLGERVAIMRYTRTFAVTRLMVGTGFGESVSESYHVPIDELDEERVANILHEQGKAISELGYHRRPDGSLGGGTPKVDEQRPAPSDRADEGTNGVVAS